MPWRSDCVSVTPSIQRRRRAGEEREDQREDQREGEEEEKQEEKSETQKGSKTHRIQTGTGDLLASVPLLQMRYMAAKGPIAFETSLAPWPKDETPAVRTCRNE